MRRSGPTYVCTFNSPYEGGASVSACLQKSTLIFLSLNMYQVQMAALIKGRKTSLVNEQTTKHPIILIRASFLPQLFQIDKHKLKPISRMVVIHENSSISAANKCVKTDITPFIERPNE